MRFYQQQATLKEVWVPWFAWHPVQVEMANGRHAWAMLETVERKEVCGYGGTQWRYRELLASQKEPPCA